MLPGGRVATGSNDGYLQVWDPAAAARPGLSVDTGHGTLYEMAALLGGRIATGSTDGEIQVWDPAHSGPLVAAIPTSHGAISGIAPLPDGRLLTASNGRLEVRDPSAFLTSAQARQIGADWPLE